MARHTGAVCRLCRREGVKLFLKGSRCSSAKCAMENRAYAPGQFGLARSKTKEYGIQLREKQKVKRMYGALERQFRRSFEKADRAKGAPGENLLKMLETRLDSVVYQGGLATSRAQARQMIRHNHFLVNGKKLDIPSARLRVGAQVTARASARKLDVFRLAIENSNRRARSAPEWLELDKGELKISVLALPTREDIKAPINERLIVELYSK